MDLPFHSFTTSLVGPVLFNLLIGLRMFARSHTLSHFSYTCRSFLMHTLVLETSCVYSSGHPLCSTYQVKCVNWHMLYRSLHTPLTLSFLHHTHVSVLTGVLTFVTLVGRSAGERRHGNHDADSDTTCLHLVRISLCVCVCVCLYMSHDCYVLCSRAKVKIEIIV